MKYCKRYHDCYRAIQTVMQILLSRAIFVLFFPPGDRKKRYLCKEFCLHTASAAPHAANAPRELIHV